MTRLITAARHGYVLSKTKGRIHIQRPEAENRFKPSLQWEPEAIHPVWKWLVALTYAFSLLGLCFAFSV